jgi:hypothetical protein
MSTAELACSYASLILADEGIEITVCIPSFTPLVWGDNGIAGWIRNCCQRLPGRMLRIEWEIGPTLKGRNMAREYLGLIVLGFIGRQAPDSPDCRQDSGS